MNDDNYVDMGGMAAWIAEHALIDIETVSTVLAVEHEYLVVLLGLADHFDPYEFRWYDPEQGPAWSGAFDSDELAADIQRFTGIDTDTSHTIFNTGLKFFEMRGLA